MGGCTNSERWWLVGRALRSKLPSDLFERLVSALERAADGESGRTVDAVAAIDEITSGSRRRESLEYLLLLIESHARAALSHDDLRRSR